MPRHLSCLLFLCLIVFTDSCKKDLLHWQSVQQLNSNTTSRLNNIKFIDNNICIVSGGKQFDQSDVLRSTDGGYTFTHNTYASAPKEMYGMGIAPNGTIYLSGVDGDVLHSSDSGKTWQFHRIDNYLVSLGGYFTTPNTGIFVSSVLQKQSSITRVDSNFKITDQQTFLFGLNNIYMTSPSTGYVIGYGAVMNTINGGDTWNFQDVKGDNFTAMDLHGNEIWMCGSNGSIMHTYDGGVKWSTFRNGNDITLPRYYLRSILFKDGMNGWATGDKGLVIHSKDGGAHWAEFDQFTTNSLRSIALCPNGDLLVAGDNGALYRINQK
ncbi:MAG: hypothetical protein JWQ38_2506 [Flavipsychrobacter sp.]|nr:hypothetical protein [Flavipsychrobacter sp.]